MKTALKLLLLVAMIAYLVYAFVTPRRDTTVCTAVRVVIADSQHAGFIDTIEVMRQLDRARLNPVGHPMDSVNSTLIEKELLRNSFIKLAQCYKSSGGTVNIYVSQRLPILRVKADNGEDYYIDDKGEPMKPQNYKADLAIATGLISKDYAKHTLIHLARQLHDNDFVNDLTTQIDVDARGNVTLIPRIGCDAIHLGTIDSTTVAMQLTNLHAFYAKVLPTVGWNKYREISLEYSGQIVCKKATHGQ